jgi:hypothetical protein
MNTACFVTPSKRPRLDSYDDEENSEELCALKPFVEQLTLAFSPSSKNGKFANLLRKITSSLLDRPETKNSDPSSLKRVNRIVILYLGFLMPPSSDDTAINGDRLELCSLAVDCLLGLCMLGTQNLTLSPGEMKEELSLILETINVLSDQIVLAASNADSSQILRTRTNCWQLIESMLLQNPALIEVLNENRPELEKLFFTLLKSLGEVDSLEQTQRKRVIVFLQLMKRQSFGHAARKLASIAMRALCNKPMDGETNPPTFTNEDQFFYWNCLSHCASGTGSPLDGAVCTAEVIDTLLGMVKAEKQSCQIRRLAMECLSLFARHLPPTHHCKEIAGALVQAIILRKNSTETKELYFALSALRCLVDRQAVSDMLLQMDQLQDLFDVLASTALKHCESYIAQEAGIVLVLILSQMVNNWHHLSKPQLHNSVALVSVLLTAEKTVAERAVDVICNWFENEMLRMQIIDLHPEIISALAKLASHEFTSWATRRQIVGIFWTMVEKDATQTNFLSSEPKVLESLVSSASSQIRGDGGSSRKLALCTLLKLSNNACNRRILAKQPGLLSSMIRCTRALSDENQEFRDVLKKQILLLASAL